MIILMASEDDAEHVKSDTTDKYVNVAEYCFFVIVSCVILTILFYYNVFNRKFNNVKEYMFGGKEMGIVPISLWLVSSHVTGITLLGVPLEVYVRGTQYWASALSLVLISLISAFVYLPVLHRLQLNSVFEYLEIRYSSHTRILGSMLYVVSSLLLLPIIPYMPMLAFSQLINLKTARIAALVCTGGAALAAAGGLRATLAAGGLTVALGAFAALLPGGLAALALGSFERVWEAAERSGRIVFYDPDPQLIHHTSFWTVTIGISTLWLWKLSVAQPTMQRLLAVPNINKARICIALSCIGVIAIKIMSCLTGLAMYAWFEGCDPVLAGHIRRYEQLLPRFLTELSVSFPGTRGIFLTAIFCAIFCTLSSNMNSLSGVIYEDFIRPCMPKNTQDWAACSVMKLVALLIGVGSGVVIFKVHDLDWLMHVVSGITGITAGTLLGLFTLGMVFHRSNCAGALSGSLISLLLCGWLLMAAENALAQGKLYFDSKPLSLHNCSTLDGVTIRTPFTPPASIHFNENNHPTSKTLSLYRITIPYCAFAGAVTVILVGIPMSYFTGKAKASTMNPDMFCPLTQRFLPKDRKTQLTDSDDYVRAKQEPVDEVYVELDEALKQLKQIADS